MPRASRQGAMVGWLGAAGPEARRGLHRLDGQEVQPAGGENRSPLSLEDGERLLQPLVFQIPQRSADAPRPESNDEGELLCGKGRLLQQGAEEGSRSRRQSGVTDPPTLSDLALSLLHDRHPMAGRMGGLDPRLQSLSRGTAPTYSNLVALSHVKRNQPGSRETAAPQLGLPSASADRL